MDNVMYTVDGAIATIAINRPHVKNAIDLDCHKELYEAFSQANEDDAVRVIVFTGSGDSFSAGADLKSIPIQDLADFDHGDYLEETYNKLLRLMDAIQKPIVAYMNGLAVGAGLSLTLACDYRFAEPGAVFALSFLKIGLVPDAGASYFLPRLVGLQKAVELGLGGTIDVSEAERIGLINGTGYPAELLAQLARVPQPAYGMMKENMKRGFEGTLSETLTLERDSQRVAGQSRAHKEAVLAFLKR
ncbi:enoyl-CoA hydratase/isomerase family protein [Paenalkalicoccus suaedae]|uniref:Enoyl-CoA hydratase/isomerase family protein n=1 Tax=Paenalkalicoccus suaedae TaxID=2592382 RepID=A0A859FHM1_9BACI|nr:enoyl-CoA hydratase-related protein [Paenalkalicoccus suaedae]QKS72843.1 enoyl-CoA hydratase/isomerase family protein [Paenalkalicoccus suaedae]